MKVTNDGQIITNGAASIGVFAQSVGGGGGSGGFAGAFNVGNGSTLTNTVGGSGAGAGNGGQVTVDNTGLIHTTNDRSIGVLAQSIGGGGGNGGFSLAASGSGGNSTTTSIGGGGGGGGSADLVSVTNSGQIVTEGKLSYGIYAQSVGGGGGNGGFTVAGTLASGSGGMVSNVGGGGGNGGNGGAVTVTNTGIIVVKGAGSVGVLAQSIGGGGGSGGFAGALSLTGGGGGQMSNNVGGHGGNGGDGGDVTVKSTGSIQTLADDSVSVLAQSIGGGGGNSAWAISAQNGGALGAEVNVGGSSNGAGGAKGKVIVDVSGGVLLTSGALSYGMLAQSIGGGGGNGAISVPDPLTTMGGGITAMVGATGGISGNGNLLTTTNANPTTTTGEGAIGLIGQSIGGGGGADGATGDISVGTGVGVLKAIAGGTSTNGGSGAAVAFSNTGNIMTSGNLAAGAVVQSIGGGGGNAVLAFGVVTGTPLGIALTAGGSEGAVGNGGTVNLPSFTGAVATSGALAAGLMAQSIGGGGGYVGFTTPTGTSVGANGVSLTVGGLSGAGGLAQSVTFNATQTVSTSGVGSVGLLGQSIGGGGGFAGFWSGGSQNPVVSSFVIGASGGAGGKGDAVNMGAGGSVFTTGTGAIGVLGQSIGGGGGVAEAFGVGSSGGVKIGAGGGAAGDGGAVTIATQLVSTTGNGAHAVVAQSIGGGGGLQMSFGSDGTAAVSAVTAGAGGGGGNGGNVTVTTNGAITTTGAGAHGIIAQSIAGGGGIVGGGAFANAPGSSGPFAGSVGGAGVAGAVTINAQANVVVTGAGSTAIYAQSVNALGVGGNIGITLGNAGLGTAQSVLGSGDGATTTNAVTFVGGANNTLTNFALLATMAGINGTAVRGGVGNEAITSFGHMIGSIDLGTGTNSIDNKPYNNNPSLMAGVFDAGAVINLGGPAAGNVLTNEGLLSPGALFNVLTTNLNGNFVQTTAGSCGAFALPTSTCGYFGVDLDLKSATADRLNATGTVNVSGAVVVNIGNAGDATPGTNTLTIISAAGGETHPNLAVQAQQTAVAQYSLVYPNATDIDLKYSIDYSPSGLTQNQHSVGNAVNAIQTAHVQTFRPIAAALFYQPTVGVLGAVYDTLSGEGVAAVEQTAISANDMFHSSILSQARFWMFDNDRNDPNSLTFYDGGRMSYAAAPGNGFPNYATKAPGQRTWRVWTTLNGGDWRYSGNPTIGTAATSSSGGGFTSGLDYQFDPTLMAGVAVGYGKAWVKIPGRDTNDSVEGSHIAGYAAKRFDNAYVMGSLGLEYFTNTESRFAAIPGTVLPPLFGSSVAPIPGFAEHLLGTFNSYSVSGMFEGGYKYRFGDYNVTPLAGLNFTSYWMNGFTENNNGAPSFIGLSFASRNINSVPTFIGAQLDTTQLLANGGSLFAWARATWVHEFLPHRTVNPSFIAAPGFDFVIDGALAPTDLARINLGAKVALDRNVSVSADVRADLYRTPSIAGFIGAKVSW
ncbi:autotransporter domain-containing protein [Bradyrhizobium quebecense]|uniref:Autotransporter domain-containing protein n=2 Tax=Bradyrhizobium quebecense TaxID=2748629 RepID=A0ABS3MSN2_9BRAD|nr:autotransporter domain-containing protein [Bradyrhizobium quebecense]UGY07397.1 autotransporter domain-containing protein [Bradyrhizobium quebecense]